MSYSRPTEKCPYCGIEMEADWADVGIGLVQCGPYYCENCQACQIGPHDKIPEDLTDKERETGYYIGRIGSSANTIDGKLVTAKEADVHYRANYFAEHGNPYNAPIER